MKYWRLSERLSPRQTNDLHFGTKWWPVSFKVIADTRICDTSLIANRRINKSRSRFTIDVSHNQHFESDILRICIFTNLKALNAVFWILYIFLYINFLV